MSKRATFVEITYADAMARHHAKRGMKLVREGGLKRDAQHELRQAIRWEKEKARLERLQKRPKAEGKSRRSVR